PQLKVLEHKVLLERYLTENIDYAFKEDVVIEDEEKEEIIDEIVSWIEFEEKLSRGEVYQRLEEFNIEPEKVLPGEKQGLVDIIKFNYINVANWDITDTLNVTIGQGKNAYTPIQMANFISTLSNGGYKHKLTLIDSIKNYDDSKIEYTHKENPERNELNDYENLEHIKEGMKRVGKTGTAQGVFRNFPVDVGVKTGTAERDEYDDFAWFVGFAPYDDPEIAVVTVLFQGGSGSYGGQLVSVVMAEYLELNDKDNKDN